MAAIDLAALTPWLVLTGAVMVFLLIDLFAFAGGRAPTFRAGAV